MKIVNFSPNRHWFLLKSLEVVPAVTFLQAATDLYVTRSSTCRYFPTSRHWFLLKLLEVVPAFTFLPAATYLYVTRSSTCCYFPTSHHWFLFTSRDVALLLLCYKPPLRTPSYPNSSYQNKPEKCCCLPKPLKRNRKWRKIRSIYQIVESEGKGLSGDFRSICQSRAKNSFVAAAEYKPCILESKPIYCFTLPKSEPWEELSGAV